MIEIADSIKAFLPAVQQADVPTEEPIFVLTSTQLQDIIKEAVQETTEGLKDEVEGLKATVARQDEKIVTLEAREPLLLREIALDRQRLTKLEQVEPQLLQKDRGEILRALLAANGGKMLAKGARQKMHMPKGHFAELLATVKEDVVTKPYHLDKRAKVLILK